MWSGVLPKITPQYPLTDKVEKLGTNNLKLRLSELWMNAHYSGSHRRAEGGVGLSGRVTPGL